MGLCGVVVLCREGWRRGSSQITLGFLFELLHTLYLTLDCDCPGVIGQYDVGVCRRGAIYSMLQSKLKFSLSDLRTQLVYLARLRSVYRTAMNDNELPT